MTETVYKIVPAALWNAVAPGGRFVGAALDLRDGFIHLSTAEQVRETASRHFAGGADLLLVAVSTAALGAALRWEASRGGDLFPHLYADLPLDAVEWVKPLPLDASGAHVFPLLA
jgi:uncharacterized protein (DUF952 family)